MFTIFQPIYYFSPFSSIKVPAPEAISNATALFPCDSLFLMWLSLTDSTPNHWPFYVEGSGFPISFCGTWTGFVHKILITLQKLKALALILCKMTVQFSGKVVALHLGVNIAKAYLCNQGGTSLSSRLACHILNVANKNGITLIPAYIPTHLNVES